MLEYTSRSVSIEVLDEILNAMAAKGWRPSISFGSMLIFERECSTHRRYIVKPKEPKHHLLNPQNVFTPPEDDILF